MDTITIDLSVYDLRAAQAVMSNLPKSDTRYYLRNVWIEVEPAADTIVYVGTNGQTMYVGEQVQIDSAHALGGFLAANDLKGLAVPLRRKIAPSWTRAQLIFDDGPPRMEYRNGKHVVAYVEVYPGWNYSAEVRYPDWRRVWKNLAGKPVTACERAGYTASNLAFLSAIYGPKAVVALTHHANEDEKEPSAVVVTPQAGYLADGKTLIMPARL